MRMQLLLHRSADKMLAVDARNARNSSMAVGYWHEEKGSVCCAAGV